MTRNSSESARRGSATEHKTSDATAASNEASSNGNDSATPSITVTGTGADRAAVPATSRRYASGSVATTSVTVAGYSAKLAPAPAPISKTRPDSSDTVLRRCSMNASGSWRDIHAKNRANNG